MDRAAQAGQRVRVALAPELTPLAQFIQRHAVEFYIAVSLSMLVQNLFGHWAAAVGLGSVVHLWGQLTYGALFMIVFLPMLYLDDDDRPLFRFGGEGGSAPNHG